ncbi:hypothetical protein [uncultured Friedmanniella sp.]|uniref:hypothetical protein n=1 Tax=uncultured Friedmanniella sp. TaxID=335381 RepID=UPI0035CA977D
MTRGELRGVVRLWLVPVVAVVVVLALVAGFGGFRSGRGAQGRSADADEVLDLARWQLVVHTVELIPADRYDPKAGPALRVHLRATFTGMRSVYGMDPRLVTVATPTATLPVSEDPEFKGPREGDFDPDVPQEITVDYRWPNAPAQSPPVVRVLVRDERQGTNYLFTTGEWNVTATPRAHLDLPCPDNR